ncbi:hypothetical protein [Pseudomonas sp. P9_31]|uniref:hypothetical protein n=1 Tax=Pseudomonas sp. P9_31 TaxID=3043448 RepID=UPI002A3591E7|nr:hypothetical protein [Pseudomonas sp. P9_31]WPN57824.1 hypothetical protein QMK51_27555 [Pseudomonas sp. P9_31]
MSLSKFVLILLFTGVAHAGSLEVCGAFIPEIPGFELMVKTENNTCYGELTSIVELSPSVLVEENIFIIRPISFRDALKGSERFNKKGDYIYSYSVDGAIEQVSEKGTVNFQRLVAFGTAELRVTMSPYALWDSEANINKAQEKFSILTSGLQFNCFYGLVGVGDSTATLSACVPKSANKMDPTIDDIKTAFEKIKPLRE